MDRHPGDDQPPESPIRVMLAQFSAVLTCRTSSSVRSLVPWNPTATCLRRSSTNSEISRKLMRELVTLIYNALKAVA